MRGFDNSDAPRPCPLTGCEFPDTAAGNIETVVFDDADFERVMTLRRPIGPYGTSYLLTAIIAAHRKKVGYSRLGFELCLLAPIRS